MSLRLSRKEASKLSLRWVTHTKNLTQDPSIEAIMYNLSVAWQRGEVLGYGEREALAMKKVHEHAPTFGEMKLMFSKEYDNGVNGLLEDIQAEFFVEPGKAAGWASKAGPIEKDNISISSPK